MTQMRDSARQENVNGALNTGFRSLNSGVSGQKTEEQVTDGRKKIMLECEQKKRDKNKNDTGDWEDSE